MQTTIGQLLLNESLPPNMRDYSRVLDKKTIRNLFEDLADNHPDLYRDVTQKMHEFAADVVTTHGRQASFALNDFRTPESVKKIRDEISQSIDKILSEPGDTKSKQNAIIKVIAENSDKVTDINYKEGLKEQNPLAVQVLSGSRGNPLQFRSLRGGDFLVLDQNDEPVPIPMLRSYAEGLDPIQYWAGSYGARRGSISKKFQTPKSGYIGKQLSAAAHRLVVTEKDCGANTGINVRASDPDNEGTVLAVDTNGIKAGTVLTPKLLKDLDDKDIVVRSPMTCQAEKGICQRCAGIRERGTFPPIGDNIGIAAAGAIAEPLSQGALGEKHKGGVATGKKVQTEKKEGLDFVNQLIQVPGTFQGAAAIASVDGRVDGIEDAPQGGSIIKINGKEHWVSADQNITVKKGDEIEAGDVLSNGVPNPALITQHKGIGEGRRYFMQQFHGALKEMGVGANRRNIELLSRGLVNHVRITDLDGPHDTVPDDLVEYDDLVRNYTPRFGFKMLKPKESVGLYLEKPVLHYSIGTKVTPRVVKTLDQHKVQSVTAHVDPPSFVPEMTRAMETLAHSDDWMVRMGGLYGVKKSVLKGVHRADTSNLHGTSYIPALAQGTEFGKAPDNKGY